MARYDRRVGVRVGLAIALVALALAGCAEEPKPSRSAEVSRTAWENGTNKGLWPFIVDEGVLTCHPPDWVTFTANGTEYALTDSARWIGHYQDVSAILAKGYVDIGGEHQPVPVSFGSMTDRGRELCP
jgi:hypothetical protein